MSILIQHPLLYENKFCLSVCLSVCYSEQSRNGTSYSSAHLVSCSCSCCCCSSSSCLQTAPRCSEKPRTGSNHAGSQQQQSRVRVRACALSAEYFCIYLHNVYLYKCFPFNRELEHCGTNRRCTLQWESDGARLVSFEKALGRLELDFSKFEIPQI